MYFETLVQANYCVGFTHPSQDATSYEPRLLVATGQFMRCMSSMAPNEL